MGAGMSVEAILDRAAADERLERGELEQLCRRLLNSLQAIRVQTRDSPQIAQLVAAGEQYLTDWFEAVIEVDDLMHAEASLQERILLSEQRLCTVDTLLTAARRRYERGVSDYLPVLAALRGQQQQQRDHLALQAALARSRVRLHRALG